MSCGRIDQLRTEAGRARGRMALALLAATLSLGAAGLPTRALAVANPDDTLTYEPYGLIHSIRSAAEVNGYLADLDTYGVGQALMQMPRFKPKTGIVKLPKHNRTMLTLWSKQAVTYNAAHATNISVTAVFNGEVKTKKKGLDLDNPTIRANMIASIESVLPTGVLGVHLDLEPYPVSPGFISLLEELDAMFARVGFHGRLSVVAPANTSRWTPSHLKRVSELVAQIDPLYYDSEYETAAAYESWMVNSLAYYSANVSPATRIVPVIPSYGENPWHFPNVENIETGDLGAQRRAGRRQSRERRGDLVVVGLLLQRRRRRQLRRRRGSRGMAVHDRQPAVLPLSPQALPPTGRRLSAQRIRISFPRVCPDSLKACACPTSANGNVRAIST